MQEPDLFKIFIKPFNELNLSYMVTGGAAAIVYGLPRLTHDIDLVVEINNDKVEIFLKMFPIDQFYCPPKEVIQTEINRNVKGHFNLIHHDTGFKADIYLIGNDSFHKWAIQRRKKFSMGDYSVFVAPPEYVIIRKLMYYKEGKSPKHLYDIRNILEISSEMLDFKKLEEFLGNYYLREEWELAQKIDS